MLELQVIMAACMKKGTSTVFAVLFTPKLVPSDVYVVAVPCESGVEDMELRVALNVIAG